ncbi:hypothetical protein VP1G_06649 [Cytospora mali]|uniref:Leucine-rich repeat domain-containing protein n=1 Tax=Cytospora mali TaxID=578113 RepID=A0A194V631_CYTMA|nr:hypothetical protein VP1G_06649 [Valsa mali var. pyri (nom. inval.)]
MKTQVQSTANTMGNAPSSLTAMNQQAKPTADAKENSSFLLKLPNETLTEICKSLCWHCQSVMPTAQDEQESKFQTQTLIHSPTKALASLSRTSRRLNEIANPVLYHGFSAAKAADMYNFMVTIADRPELGKLVKGVVIEHVTLDDENHNLDMYISLVLERLKALGAQRKSWNILRAIAKRKGLGQYEALAQVILAHLRNIETLRLEMHMESPSLDLFNKLANVSRDSIPVMKPATVLWPHLQDCTLLASHMSLPPQSDVLDGDIYQLWSGSSLTAYKGFFSLAPRLSSLHTRSMNYFTINMTGLENITRLHLQLADFQNGAYLEEMVSSIYSLEEFSFTWTPGTTFVTDLSHLLDLGNRLDRHKNTLRTLRIGYSCVHGGDDEFGCFPDLTRFTVLEELKLHGPMMPIPAYLNLHPKDYDPPHFIDLLPVSIRRIHVMYTGKQQVEHLVELAEDSTQPPASRRLPYLEEVTVMSFSEHGDDSNKHSSVLDQDDWDEHFSVLAQADWDKLHAAYDKTGIAFSTRTSSLLEWDLSEFH